MDIDAYFARVGYDGPREPTVATLDALMDAHVHAVPFENLDVQLRVPLNTDVDEAFDKIVRRRRGGWCYEQNGLFGAVLAALGFEVTRVSAGVMMMERGEAAFANHLCLLVRVDGEEQARLADVGFGGSLTRSLVLSDGIEDSHPPYSVKLSRLRDGWYRFIETPAGGQPFSFDFPPEAADEQALSDKCVELQTSPDSSFVLNLVAQRRHRDVHLTLRGRSLRTRTSAGMSERLIESADELVAVLSRGFGLEVPEAADLWPSVQRRHAQIEADNSDSDQ